MRAAKQTYDALIFGGGLAGAMLAERFLASGKRPLLVNDPKLSQCSRVAAGLINPIGGKRLKLVWKAQTLIPIAKAYYEKLAAEHGRQFFHSRAIARLFSQPAESELWLKRLRDSAYQGWTAPLETLELRSEDQGFAIPEAGYLDTNALLETLLPYLEKKDCYLSSKFGYDEILPSDSRVSFRDCAAPIAIFAEGHLATGNPWFDFAPFKPAKGVIATVTLPEPRTQDPEPNSPIILKNKFVVPRHDGLLQVGATYCWDDATDEPDNAGIQELERFLDERYGAGAWRFVEIRAGVRPATAGAYPIVGPHPTQPCLFAFNGFGSKGAMQIPYFAQGLVESIYHQEALSPEVLPTRFVKRQGPEPKRWTATTVARDRVLPLLEPGDKAIDATCGNGRDTLWLCQAVGETGHVFAFDLQREAIEKTGRRLKDAGFEDRATLFQSGHETMVRELPAEAPGTIAAIVFNLGYLPGGDEDRITKTDTTLAALEASLGMLKPGGILSVTVYPFHQGGKEESEAVLAWTEALDADAFQVEVARHPTGNARSPYPVFVRKT